MPVGAASLEAAELPADGADDAAADEADEAADEAADVAEDAADVGEPPAAEVAGPDEVAGDPPPEEQAAAVARTAVPDTASRVRRGRARAGSDDTVGLLQVGGVDAEW